MALAEACDLTRYPVAGSFRSRSDQPLEKRKEVKIMSYVKPEVAVLGDATSVILGRKQQAQEPGQPAFIKNLLTSTDAELDS